jgi:hypothetical protein
MNFVKQFLHKLQIAPACLQFLMTYLSIHPQGLTFAPAAQLYNANLGFNSQVLCTVLCTSNDVAYASSSERVRSRYDKVDYCVGP